MKNKKNKLKDKKIIVLVGLGVLIAVIALGLKFEIINPKNLLSNVLTSGEKTITLIAIKDVGIHGEAANSGYYQRGASPTINYRGKKMGLYWFDLSSIPKEAKITDSRLVLYSVPSTKEPANFDVAGSLPIYVVQSLSPNNSVVWSEGSGVDTYDQYKGTSWLAKDTASSKPKYLWSDKTGRFATGDIASAFESSPVGNMNFVKAYGEQSSSNIASGIERIIQNDYRYEGFVVDKGNTVDTPRKDNIATKEYPDGSMHPALRITYTLVDPEGDTELPVVIIETPTTNPFSTEKPTITISGKATDNDQVEKVSITNNGQVISSVSGASSWSTTLTLQKGENKIIVTAEDMAGNTGKAQTTIVYGDAETIIPKIVDGYVIEQVDGIPAPTNTKKIYTPATNSLPGKCQTFVDQNTGLKVTRISDVKDIPGIRTTMPYDGVPGRGMHNGYSKYTNVNVTGQYVIAYGVEPGINGLYDVKNCIFVSQIKTGGGSGLGEAFDVRWDLSGVPGTETTIIYYYGATLYKQDVLVAGSQQVLFEFRKIFADEFASLGRDVKNLMISTEGHGDQSNNARYRGVKLYDYKTAGWGKLLLLDLKDKKIIFSLPNKWGYDVSPSGKWFYTDGGGFGPYYFYSIPDLVKGNEVKVKLPIKNNHGHDGWAYDKDGNEVYVYQDNATDWFSAYNPVTNKTINIINMKEMGYGLGQHMARISNPNKKGWLLMGTYTCSVDSWAYNQIFMLEIKPAIEKPRIWRLASTNNSWCGAGTTKVQRYFSEAFANIDYAGNNVYWGANWGGKDNLELYQIALPTDWEQTLR